MTEYSKMKARQAEQLGSIDDVHPMKQVAVMSVVQVAVFGFMMLSFWLIGLFI